MHSNMFKFVFLLLVVLLLSNSACRVNAECIEDGLDCIIDEECCTGYCDWRLSYYPFSGGCAPRPLGPLPPKPCIPLYSGEPCVYNVTCCQGYCEKRFTPEGYCVIGAPPGFPPIASPAPIEGLIAPVSAPVAPVSAPVASDLAPSPILSRKNGAKKKPASPTPSQSRKDKGKKKHGHDKSNCAGGPAPSTA